MSVCIEINGNKFTPLFLKCAIFPTITQRSKQCSCDQKLWWQQKSMVTWQSLLTSWKCSNNLLKSESYKHAHATVLFLFSKWPINLLKHSAGSASTSDTLPEPLSWLQQWFYFILFPFMSKPRSFNDIRVNLILRSCLFCQLNPG